MDELLPGLQLQFIELLLQKILNGFYIVVGNFFEVFYFLGISFGKMCGDSSVRRENALPGKSANCGNGISQRRNEILHLYIYPVFY